MVTINMDELKTQYLAFLRDIEMLAVKLERSDFRIYRPFDDFKSRLEKYETFDDVMNEVAKSALGLEPYGVSLENGLTDEVFDYMFDEAGEWIVEHKLPHAIESLNFMIERSRLEEVYDDLTKEILCSITDCANYMRVIYEEAYNEALSMLSVVKEKYSGNDDVLGKLDAQLKNGNFDDWYKYHVENQVRMNDIVGVLGQLGHLVHELNK